MNTVLIVCPFCRTPIPTDSIYCDTCGERLRKCVSCGAFAKSKRCTKCGNTTEEIQYNKPIVFPAADDKNSAEDEKINVVPGHLVCLSSNLRIGFSDGAIIGRRGSYGNAFQCFPSISGLHAQLISAAESWKIEDIGSSYGTYLNGIELDKNKPATIKIGDILKFADIEFKVTE